MNFWGIPLAIKRLLLFSFSIFLIASSLSAGVEALLREKRAKTPQRISGGKRGKVEKNNASIGKPRKVQNKSDVSTVRGFQEGKKKKRAGHTEKSPP